MNLIFGHDSENRTNNCLEFVSDLFNEFFTKH